MKSRLTDLPQKKWVIKPKSPAKGDARSTLESILNDQTREYCSCVDCERLKAIELENYTLKVDLEEERDAMTKAIVQIRIFEDQYQRELKELRNKLENEINRYSALEKTLQEERQLRLEEIYKKEKVMTENKVLNEECKTIKIELMKLQEISMDANRQLSSLKFKSDSDDKIINRLSEQLKQYEFQLLQHEQTNVELRQRLLLVDSKLSSFSLKSQHPKKTSLSSSSLLMQSLHSQPSQLSSSSLLFSTPNSSFSSSTSSNVLDSSVSRTLKRTTQRNIPS